MNLTAQHVARTSAHYEGTVRKSTAAKRGHDRDSIPHQHKRYWQERAAVDQLTPTSLAVWLLLISCSAAAATQPPEIRNMAERLVPKVHIEDDDAFFAAWDLDYAGIESVKEAVQAGDLAAAKIARKAYFLQRRSPKWRTNHWQTPGGFEKQPAPVAIFEQTSTDRAHFDTVLYPLDVGKTANVRVERLSVSDAAGGATAAANLCSLRIDTDEGTDYYINDLRQREIGPANGRVKIAGPVETDARAAVIRLDTDGQLQKASAVAASFIKLHGEAIWQP